MAGREEKALETSQHWQDWIAAHGPQLVLFARRWANSHAAAEDLVQEAFVRFWRTRESVQDPLAYMYQCARTVAIDAARSQCARDQREAHVAEHRTEQPMFVDTFGDQERRQRIEMALAELPAVQAEVVTLKIWSELTFEQIAVVTGAPVGTVASRYRYAMERLRRNLDKSELI